MSLSYEDMLKEAAARQKANDAANQRLLLQKKQIEVEQKKKLIEEHKKLSGRKDVKPAEKKPANLNDLLSTYKIPKKKLDGEEGTDRRHSSSHRGESSRNGQSSHNISQNRQPTKPLSSHSSQRDLSSRNFSSNNSRSSNDIRAPSSFASKSSTSTMASSAPSQRSSSNSLSSNSKLKPSNLSQSNGKVNGSSLSKNNITSMSTKPQNRPTTHLDNTKALIHPPKSLAVSNGSSKNGTQSSKSSGNDMSDILSGAKHSSKVIHPSKPTVSSQRPRVMPPPASSKPAISKAPVKPAVSSKTSSSSSKVPQRGPPPSSNGRPGMPLSSKHSLKPSTIRKPAAPPASFEEMMRLAATNLNKGDTPIQQNPPPPKPKLPRDPPPSIKEVKKSQMTASKTSSSSQKDIKTLSSSSQRDTKKPLSGSLKTTASSISQKPISKYPSNNYSNTKPNMMAKNDKFGMNDRPKPAVDGRLKNPERFRNSMPPVKRPASSVPADRYNAVPKDRYPPPSSRDRYNPASFNRHQIPTKRPRYDEEEDDYDDDEDSMDDFIVDDEAEDVEKELRNVLRGLCRSDETVWQKREREIDLSKMNARFHDIDAEEKRSTRIARLEDMIEEHRGSQAL